MLNLRKLINTTKVKLDIKDIILKNKTTLELTEDAKKRLKIGLEKGRVEWDIILDAKIKADEELKEVIDKIEMMKLQKKLHISVMNIYL